MTDLPLEHVSIPPNTTTNRPPAVVLIHGRGAHERDLLPLADRLPNELHVLAVRAPDPLGPDYTWYDLDLSAGGLQASQPDMADFDRSLELLESFVDEAIDAYDIDREAIGLLGFSQGAILALAALVERPTAYRWIVALHGYLPDRYDAGTLQRLSETPVFIGAGAHDEIIPAFRAKDASDRLATAGVEVTAQTYPIGHGTSPEEVDDVAEWIRSILEPSDSDAV